MTVDYNRLYIDRDSCEKCPLKDAPHAYGIGPVPSDIMLIGEAPGAVEAQTGIPFVGAAGKKLDFGLTQAGIDRESVYITNAVLGHPTKDGSNRTPTTAEVKCCSKRLLKEIESVNPKVIVMLGKTAMQSIMRGAKKDITKVMGQEVWSEEFNAFLLPVLHPAALLYSPAKEEHFMRHLTKISTLINWQEPETDYQLIWSTEKFDEMLEYLKDKTRISVDIETNRSKKAFLIGSVVTAISFSAEKGKAFVLPLFYKERLFTEDQIYGYLQPRLKALLEDHTKRFVGHNLKFDSIFLKKNFNIILQGYDDTMIAHHLLDENSRHGLKPLASDFTELGNYSQDFKEHEDPFMEAPPDQFYHYSCSDADATLRLADYILPRIKEEDLTVPYNMVLKFNEALTDVEYRGAKVDLNMLGPINQAMEKAIDKVNWEIKNDPAVIAYQQDTKIPFNPKSSKQLRELFFRHLKLPVIKTTKLTKAPSTDQEVLIELAHIHPLPANLLRSRKLNHLYSSFLKNMEMHLQDDGKIHTNFNIAHTRTGRLSSSEPNLQNLPARGGGDKFVKRLFIPSYPDWAFIDLDYSQIELRVLAMLSGEPKLIHAYENGEDIHRATAESIFKTKDITKEMRAVGKKINFSVIYGEREDKLARELAISIREASQYINDYFLMYPEVDKYIKITQNSIRRLGYVRSPLGRYRRLPEVFTFDKMLIEHALRQGVNFTIQSTASDITQTALYKINRYLQQGNYPAQVVLTVHDSIVVECAISYLAQVFNLCLKVMSSVKFPFMTVPIEAEGKVGWNYADTVEWDGKSDGIIEKMTDAVTDSAHVSKLIEMIGNIDEN